MNEALIVIFGVAVTAIVGLFVLTRDIRSLATRLYGLMTLAFITLMTANLFTYGELTDEYAMLWCIRIVAVSTIIAFTSLYFLTQTLALDAKMPRFNARLNEVVFWVSCLTILFTVSPIAFSGLTINESSSIQVQVSWGIIPFVIVVLGLMVLTVVHLVRGTTGVSAKLRAQNISILTGLIPAILLAPMTSFLLPVVYHLTGFVGLSPFYIIFFVLMVAYAMIRYGLFDVRLAAVRTAAYLLTILSMASLYMVLVYFVSDLILQNQASVTASLLNPVAVGSALLIGFLFQPIRKLFNKLTDGLFYKDNYSISDFITRLSRVLNSTNDLRRLLEKTSKIIADTLKSSQTYFVINLPNDRYLTAGLESHSKVTPGEFVVFDDAAHITREIMLLSSLQIDDPARRMMISNRLHLIMPLRKKDRVVGYLCLGEPQNIRYTARDTRALAAISDELIIAIENALSVEEVRRLNATLEQRINSATKELRASNAQLQRLDETKDEFISMASHQLRTPLTSIKGYLSMLIEGDVGDVTNDQKHVLNEAFISSERMVRLIGDFLNVSRLQTGKFVIDKHPVDLALLVQREIDALHANAAARGMTFSYNIPKNIPNLELDENKIQQVVMNFSDNAIYYSKENATIKVVLKKVPGFVEFKVIDSGIGVPLDEQANLFNKFFRATNARKQRPDGTGVGLFLAKKVVDAHGGEIIFESKEKKGSTFGFRLPLPK